MLRLLGNRLSTNTHQIRPPQHPRSRAECCSAVVMRACNHRIVNQIQVEQAECNRQRWMAHLDQGSEYEHDIKIFTCLHKNELFYRRFAQRSAWLLLERADEPFAMVRIRLSLLCTLVSSSVLTFIMCNFPPHHSLTNCIVRV